MENGASHPEIHSETPPSSPDQHCRVKSDEVLGALLRSTSAEGLRRVMLKLDSNQAGSLSRVEMQRALEKLGVSLTREELTAFFKRFDKDGDGKIEFKKLFAALMAHETKRPSPRAAAADGGQDAVLSVDGDAAGPLSPPSLDHPLLSKLASPAAGAPYSDSEEDSPQGIRPPPNSGARTSPERHPREMSPSTMPATSETPPPPHHEVTPRAGPRWLVVGASVEIHSTGKYDGQTGVVTAIVDDTKVKVSMEGDAEHRKLKLKAKCLRPSPRKLGTAIVGEGSAVQPTCESCGAVLTADATSCSACGRAVTAIAGVGLPSDGEQISVGARVTIFGTSKAKYNGKAAVVVALIDDARATVALASDAKQREHKIKTKHLRLLKKKVPPKPPGWLQPPPGPALMPAGGDDAATTRLPAVGDTIKLHGLSNEKFNSKKAVVTGIIDRMKVKFYLQDDAARLEHFTFIEHCRPTTSASPDSDARKKVCIGIADGMSSARVL